MKTWLQNNAIALLIAAIGGVSGYFQGTGAAKENSAKEIDKRIDTVERTTALISQAAQLHKEADEKYQDDLKKKVDALLWDRGINPEKIVAEKDEKKDEPELLTKEERKKAEAPLIKEAGVNGPINEK